MPHTAPIIEGQRFDYASHFFPRFKDCYYVNCADGNTTLSLDPTKLMPKEITQKDGSKRLELSVILHKYENDIGWEIGAKLYPVKGIAQCCVDFPCQSCGSELYVETDEDSAVRISKFHANIIGWSDDEDYQQLQAIELASVSHGVVNPKCADKFENFRKNKILEYTDKTKIKISVSPLPKIAIQEQT